MRYPTELVLILPTFRTLSNWPESVPPLSDTTTRLGGWLFRHRTSLPLPAAVAILTLRLGEAPPSVWLLGSGIAITVVGELIRIWGVHHIGAISRTRSERLGPLVASGPFALLRNPLYVGNIALWVGFALAARLVWLAPVILLLLALEYHAIVRWEETLLESRLGKAYRDYAARVPRWVPTFAAQGRERRNETIRSAEGAVTTAQPGVKAYSWRETLFSERGTLIAIAVGYVVLWLKLRT
jgi:protein-S-isoprenylcysteine O-methyltransferase Ste14